mmetsp:Transcript_35154/g.97247  ORF Transcript_35154/g.97247 Transcript_35154/m.97247 type:complete len:233 (+) Transcript_35154:1385-2083(+)
MGSLVPPPSASQNSFHCSLTCREVLCAERTFSASSLTASSSSSSESSSSSSVSSSLSSWPRLRLRRPSTIPSSVSSPVTPQPTGASARSATMSRNRRSSTVSKRRGSCSSLPHSSQNRYHVSFQSLETRITSLTCCRSSCGEACAMALCAASAAASTKRCRKVVLCRRASFVPPPCSSQKRSHVSLHSAERFWISRTSHTKSRGGLPEGSPSRLPSKSRNSQRNVAVCILAS